MDDTQEAGVPQTLNLEEPKEQGAGSQDSNRVTQRTQFAFQPKTSTKGRKRMCVGTPRAPTRLPTMHTRENLEAIAAAEARLNGRIELLCDSFKKQSEFINWAHLELMGQSKMMMAQHEKQDKYNAVTTAALKSIEGKVSSGAWSKPPEGTPMPAWEA